MLALEADVSGLRHGNDHVDSSKLVSLQGKRIGILLLSDQGVETNLALPSIKI